MTKGNNGNHPEKGSTIKVEPVKTMKDIKAIKALLAKKQRDLVLFTLDFLLQCFAQNGLLMQSLSLCGEEDL